MIPAKNAKPRQPSRVARDGERWAQPFRMQIFAAQALTIETP